MVGEETRPADCLEGRVRRLIRQDNRSSRKNRVQDWQRDHAKEVRYGLELFAANGLGFECDRRSKREDFAYPLLNHSRFGSRRSMNPVRV